MRELLAEQFEVLVHNFASLELFVVEMNHSVFKFGDVVQKLSLNDLNETRCTYLYYPKVRVSS